MKTWPRKTALTLTTAFIFSGCTTPQNSANTTAEIKQNTNTSTTEAFYGSYMFIRDCPEVTVTETNNIDSMSIEPITGMIAANAVKAGIDILGRAITKAATDDVNETRVQSNITSPDSLKNKCIDIIRSKFRFANTTESSQVLYEIGALENTGIKPAGVIISGHPDLRITLLPVVKNSTITFIPLRLEYSGKTPKAPNKPKARELAIAIGFATTDKDALKDTFAARTIDFGLITPKKQSTTDADSNSNAVISFMSGTNVFSANQTQYLKLTETGPISIAATIIETKKAGQMAKFWKDVFEASKEEIKTAAETAVKELEIFKTKEDLDRAKWDKQEAENTAKFAFYDSLTDIAVKKVALDKLCASSPTEADIYKAQTELYKAQSAAMIRREKAGIAEPRVEATIPNGVCS